MLVLTELNSEPLELSSEDLVPAANATLLEQRANAMLLDHLNGKTNQEIALRYGVPDPSVVGDMIRGALDSCIAKKEHRKVQTSLVYRLTSLDLQLAELYEQTPSVQKLKFQVLNSRGQRRELWKEEGNVQTRVKIISERRQNAIAIDKIVSINTGERRPDEDQADKDLILEVVRAAARGMAEEISEQARDAGRLEGVQIVDVEAEEVKGE